MTAFSEAELAFLAEGGKLGRLATVDSQGQPHVVPVGWNYNPETGTIDIGGRDLTNTKKFRNIRDGNRKVAIVIDEVLPPWRPRCVQVRGTAEALDASTAPGGRPIIRITPTKIVSWGLEPGDNGLR